MKRGILVLVAVSVLCGLIGLFGCVGKGKQAEKQTKVLASVEVPAVSTQGWKTYVSKYGFSVKYPADWYLKEELDERGRDKPEGYRPFDIYNYDADHPKNEPGVSISFGFNDETTQGMDKSMIPSDPYQKIVFLAKKHNLFIGKNESDRSKLYMAYPGILIKIHNKLSGIMFYIPESDALLGVDLDSEYGTAEYMAIIRTIKRHENIK